MTEFHFYTASTWDTLQSFYGILSDGNTVADISTWFQQFRSSTASLSDVQVLLMQISLAFCTFMLGIMFFTMLKIRALKPAPTVAAAEPVAEAAPVASAGGALRKQWERIAAHLDSPRETDWKVAVMEADKLADDALQRAGFAGATFGDRLAAIQPGTLRSLDGLWWAHKIRNRLAHEVDYFLRYTEAKQAVGYIEATLAELNLI